MRTFRRTHKRSKRRSTRRSRGPRRSRGGGKPGQEKHANLTNANLEDLHTVDPEKWNKGMRLAQRFFNIAEPQLRAKRNADILATRGRPRPANSHIKGKIWAASNSVRRLQAKANEPGKYGELAAAILPYREQQLLKFMAQRTPLDERLDNLSKEAAERAKIAGVHDI